MDEQVPTRRRPLIWLAIIMATVAFVVAILTSRWRRQRLQMLLQRRRSVAPPPPIRLHGLTEAEAEARRLEGQDNPIHLKPPRTRREIWRENVYTIFNLNLVGLALVQFLLSRPLDALLSLGTMCLNIGLQVAREVGAQHRLQEIEQATRVRATVIREERARSIDPSEIVLGDVLVAGPGDLLLVDGEIVGEGEIVLDESRLSGHSGHIARRAGDKVYAGSLCISGRAAYEAQRVGSERRIAATTGKGQAVNDELTALERTVDRILRVLLLIVGIFAALLLAIYFGVDTGIPEDVFTSAVALIFNIAPSSLFFMIILTYTAGTARLAKLGALVHRARSVESLAQATVICFAEAGIVTGTHVEVEPIEVPEEQERLAESRIRHILGDYARSTSVDNLATRSMAQTFEGSQRPMLEEVSFLAVYGWSAVAFDDEDLRGVYVLGEPQVLEGHFSRDGEQRMPEQEGRAPLAALQEMVTPVSRLFRRRDRTSQEDDSLGELPARSPVEAVPVRKPPGSLEAQVEVLEGNVSLEDVVPTDEGDLPSEGVESGEGAPSGEGGTKPNLFRRLFAGVNRRLRRGEEKQEEKEAAEEQAAREVSLLFAYDPESTQLYDVRGEPCLPPGLRPLCRLRYVERVRPEAVNTIQAFAETGVSIKVFTSDAPEQTAAALREAGLGSGEELPLRTISGPQLAELGAAQFSRAAEEHTVFGLLSSAEAERLVRALRKAGQSVAVVGDRANDLAAMEQASLAIARRSSTQAALRVADIVLLEDSPGVLTDVLDKGQRIASSLLDV
ncbi:MAG TPA: HAD family hydrolase, partial [Anaerolineae bacterium]|nr:HAD family hydrolase [Anaerolineae bacterium]